MSVNEIHEEKNTFQVDVNIPGHDPRNTTPLFTHSRKELLKTVCRCFICNRTEEESGAPLEAHHYPIERSFATMIDWSEGAQIRKDFPDFDWSNFDPANPYTFVDDMRVNGLILCKKHHIGKDEGIHDLPHPIWIAQRYGQDGYKFSSVEIIHHGT